MKTTILAFLLIAAYSGKSSAQNFGVERGAGYPFSTKSFINEEPFNHSHHTTSKFKIRTSVHRTYGIAFGYESAYHSGYIQPGQLTILIPTEGKYHFLQMGFFRVQKGRAKCLRGFGIGSQLFLNPILRKERAYKSFNPYLSFSRSWPLSKHIERMYFGPSIRIVSIPRTGMGFTVAPTFTLSYYPF